MDKLKDCHDESCFWKDKNIKTSIHAAVPLEQLSLPDLIFDHFECDRDEIKKLLKTFEGSQFASKSLHNESETAPQKKFTMVKPTKYSTVSEIPSTQVSTASNVLPIEPSDDLTTVSTEDSNKMVPTGNQDPAKYVPILGLEIVSDENLSHYPFKCVGKLFWYRKDHEKNANYIIYFATAFYIGNNRIITAAHSFDCTLEQGEVREIVGEKLREKHLREAIFVPAMKNRRDDEGDLYGYYHVKHLKILPGYTPITQTPLCVKLDICSAEIIGGNELDKKLGRRYIDLKESSGYIYGSQSSSQLFIYGYGEDSNNKDGKMCVLHSMILPPEYPHIIKATPGAALGMSGGPWMLYPTTPIETDEGERIETAAELIAIGSQSGTTFEKILIPVCNNTGRQPAENQVWLRGCSSSSPMISPDILKYLCTQLI